MNLLSCAVPIRALTVFLCCFSSLVFAPASANDCGDTASSAVGDIVYCYDKLGRLTKEIYIDSAFGGGDITYTYQYDDTGNRTLWSVQGNANPTIYIRDAYALEGSIIEFPLYLAETGQDKDVSFTWQVTEGAEFVDAGSLSGEFSATLGATRGTQVDTIAIQLRQDAVKNSYRTIKVQISNSINIAIDPSNNTANGIIQDDDTVYFTPEGVSGAIIEGAIDTFSVARVDPSGAGSSPTVDVNVDMVSSFQASEVDAISRVPIERLYPSTF